MKEENFLKDNLNFELNNSTKSPKKITSDSNRI